MKTIASSVVLGFQSDGPSQLVQPLLLLLIKFLLMLHLLGAWKSYQSDNKYEK